MPTKGEVTAVRIRYDVVILGAGLAGLSLARQLLLEKDLTILVLDKQKVIPPNKQKVGEATVQVSGYYFSKVLDLEEYLFCDHFMKYNLRFYWKTPGRENRDFEDYTQCYIRNLSNIASYQLDRNKLEAELLRLNLENGGFDFLGGTKKLDVDFSETSVPGGEEHAVRFELDGKKHAVRAGWVIDTTGRGKYTARRLGFERKNPIRHGSSFFWVDGLVNVEKLTGSSPRQIRLKKDRKSTGHLPIWLATNHFAGESFWFWIIPLQGKTSLGIVYDNVVFPKEKVSTPEKTVKWICEQFPLLARDLPKRKIIDQGFLGDFSHDCSQTIHHDRWALSGEAGRFTDPLYSPGGDLIALYNTMITDAILTEDQSELSAKCRLYEPLMRALYEAYIPSYEAGYLALGDAEVFSLKYTWELTVYFAFYVFPFINELFTDRKFIPVFLTKFARLGKLNRTLQSFLADFYRWKKANAAPPGDPVFHDFMELGPLKKAEMTFYQIGVTAEEAKGVLEMQLENLQGLARFIVAHVYSVVLNDPRAKTNRAFVEKIELDRIQFEPEEMKARLSMCSDHGERYDWPFDVTVLDRFRDASAALPTVMAGDEKSMKPHDQGPAGGREEGK